MANPVQKHAEIPTLPLHQAGHYICNADGKAIARLENGQTLDVARFMVQACNSHQMLLEALKEIAKHEGAFSLDHLTHANNTIEHMTQIAVEAIAQVPGKESE